MRQIIFFISFIFFLFIHFSAFSQDNEPGGEFINEPGYMFRLILKDKGNTPYSISKPEEFLSQKAIDRRLKQGFSVDSTDLPLDPGYLSAIREKGAEIKVVSKWLNTVLVYFPDSAMITSVLDLSFIDSVAWVWVGELPDGDMPKPSKYYIDTIAIRKEKSFDASYYGSAYEQIKINKGNLLHKAGFRGDGMAIAVLDGSFTSVNNLDFLNPSRILGYRNFSHQEYLPSEDDEEHGTKVLSCMLANKPGEMVGTAPNASYYLIRTEVSNEEYAEEEDYWIAGIEYADSLGVDIVTSSLGYTVYDAPSMNHTHKDLNGQTAQISKAASLASKKGILVFVSAGNEKNKEWGKICFPGDAEGVVTVGSIDSEKEIAYFSSVGYTADDRIKPDLMAKGINVSVVYPSGDVASFASGTSFSTPILAGLGACLWQALPNLTNLQIIDLLRKNADRYKSPNSLFGYGIPDVYQAYKNAIKKNIKL